MISQESRQRLASLLLFVAPAMTLAIVPSVMYDPINLIKVLILATVGLSCFGILFGEFRKGFLSLPNLFKICIASLLIALFVSFAFSGAPIGQQLWGSFGRNTGLLTYISLIGILLAATTIRTEEFTEKLVKVLILTNIPLGIYCIIQILGLDPVNWSSFAPFGTLGNVNFLSAFLGMCATAGFLLIFSNEFKLSQRLWLSLLTLINLFIILESDSIQGFFVFASGIFTGLFFVVKSLAKSREKVIMLGYTLFAAVIGIFVALGLANRGPLARLIYQETLDFRIDYMRAAIQMMKREPLTGIGLDSYGDWYLADRDAVAAFRTSFTRTSNSAHNIFLDVGSNSGLLGFIGYLGFTLFIGAISLRKLLRAESLNIYHVALFSSWVGYLMQSLASINQIGVGIWGWLYSGALLGHALIPEKNQENSSQVKQRKKTRVKGENQLRPFSAILGFIGMVLGFSLAAIPINADVKFQVGNSTANLTELMEASKTLGSTSIHIGKTLEIANNNKFTLQAKEINDLLIKEYPREVFGWTILRTLDNPDIGKVNLAIKEISQLDPYGASCLAPDATNQLLLLLRALPLDKQQEVVKYWGLPSDALIDSSRPFEQITPSLQARIESFCR